MDCLSAADQQPTEPGTLKPPPLQPGTAAGLSPRLRDRRREKSLLSCTFCRARKVRCDRQLPCKTCTSRGVGLSCTYMSSTQHKTKVSVGDRIEQLEKLVRSLVQQQQQTPQTPAVHPDVAVTDALAHPFWETPSESPQSAADDDTMPPLKHVSMSHCDTSPAPSPASSEYGSMRLHSHGAKYVGSVHWAAVLDSISELKDHYEEEEEARMLATSDHVPYSSPGPLLLYQPVQATKADILASIPARPAVDRMVARYFNAQNTMPIPVLHSGHFLREYESFWQEPTSASFLWIGILFSIMALAMQYQHLIEDPPDPETLARIHMFRERTIHCLVLGQFTRGKDYVLETMVNYVALEVLLCKDADIGLWLVVGMLVQLALSLGYHRDAQNFPNVSPFAGEMRRRVWATVMQMDLRLSSQMGLPRLLKLHQCDTAEPRNLLDTDFNEATVELPLSRPETEVTPVLYILAKNRIDRISGLVSDLLADTCDHPYTAIMELDDKLQEAEASLPPIFRWQPLSQSFMVPPEIVMHRVWLQLAIPRLTIWLHRKYLAMSYTQADYEYSRNACIQAAIKILEFQQLLDEETRPDGLLYPVRWMMITSLGQFVFLLGMSILCYYVQLAKVRPEISLDQETGTRIYNLLCNTYPIWLRSSTVSREAQQAAEHLSLLLGLRGRKEGGIPPTEEAAEATTAATSQFTMPLDSTMSFDQVTWDTYQECIANFPSTGAFGTEFLTQPMPGLSSGVGLFTTDLMAGNTGELCGWME